MGERKPAVIESRVYRSQAEVDGEAFEFEYIVMVPLDTSQSIEVRAWVMDGRRQLVASSEFRPGPIFIEPEEVENAARAAARRCVLTRSPVTPDRVVHP